MQKSIFTILLSSISLFLAAQGSIAGVVKDAQTGETIIGANVVIQGTTIGSPTDIDGTFLINNVKEGTYTLEVSFVTYKTHVIQNVVVETAKRVSLDIQLAEDVSELQEVVVTAKSHTDTDYDLVKNIKLAQVVVSGISSEQISKTLDRDAAQVVRRVPGVTIKDDEFIVIRGLSERYNAVMLNGAYAPSVETDVRSFSFANIPSSQLDRILIFKSPAADLPGDFGGGVVKVFTKGVPGENSLVIDYSTQVRAGTTFQDFYHQERDPYHATGFNTGYYDLPSNFPTNLGKLQQSSDLTNAGRMIKNLWTPQRSTAIPDQRATITLNRSFNLGNVEVGSITALNYSNSYKTFDVTRGDYTESLGSIFPNFEYKDIQYNQAIRTGLISNWSFNINNNHKIDFKNLYNQGSNEQYVNRTGTGISEGQLNGSFDKVYRSLYSGQLNGSHELFNNSTAVEWMAAYNETKRDQPDYRRYRSNYDDQTGLASVQIPNTTDPNFLGKFYGKLSENAYSGALSVKQMFDISSNPLRNPEVKAGVFMENKSRDFNARNIGYHRAGTYLNPSLTYAPIGVLFETQNINNVDGIQIGEQSYKKNSYAASNNLFAYYAMASIPFAGKFKLDGGVRIENNTQKLSSYDDFKQAPVNVNNPITRLLPSANLSYNFNDKALIRAAYGQTLNRPEFRELAPFSFYDFNFNFLYVGNPALKTARIQNMDLRYELYPSRNEMISVGVFYKYFLDPIEKVVDINTPGGGLKNVYFSNAQSATSYGTEIEVKKSLAGLTGSKLVDNLSLVINATLIKSRIKLSEQQALGQDTDRPLQYQAPYTINAAAFYNDEESGWQWNLLYNVVGKSITFVGNENYHTVYLMPRGVLDLTFNKRIGTRWQLKGGVTDILNQAFLLLQDGNNDGKLDRKNDQVIQKYNPGQVFSLGCTLRI